MINDYLHSNDNYDYILWIDADAIFINFNTKIEQFISRSLGRDILIAEDMNPCCLINAGVILIKNTKWSQELFKQVWELDRYDHVKFYEQSALVKVLRLQGQRLEQYKPFHTYVKGGISGDKIFDNVIVVPHIDFNTNSGWLHMSNTKTGITKLRRRKVKEQIRNSRLNNIDDIDNTNTNDNDNDDDECCRFIFHAAGLKDKTDALLYMINKFNIDIQHEQPKEQFKLLR
jgi:hypothetical protein